jgi:VanZ family protein
MSPPLTRQGSIWPAPNARFYAWMTAAFAAFVIYGSLVPFHFRPIPWDEAWTHWQSVCSLPVKVESRSDWAANILLFIPLGFLGMAALAVDRGRAADLWALPVLAACAAFSASIEFLQLYFPPRVSSLSDVAAESIGAALGIAGWVVAGRQLTRYARRLWTTAKTEETVWRLLLVYLAVLVLMQAMPLDLTISPSELYHKYKNGMVRPVPFSGWRADPQAGLKKALENVAWFLPGGILLGHLARWSRWNVRVAWEVFGLGLAGAAAIEFMQLFVASRSCDATDVLTGGAAVLAGWLAVRAELLAATAWVGVLVYLNWFPFNFASLDAATARWQRLSWLPFADYLQGHYIDVMQMAVDKVMQFLVLGALLALSVRTRNKRALVTRLAAAALLAVVLEGGQLFLPTRYASVTDVLVQTSGAGLGLLLLSRLPSVGQQGIVACGRYLWHESWEKKA